jgi:hypothetical protein
MRIILSLLLLNPFLRLNAQNKERFYPDGYYFPQASIKIKNWEFDWLSIFIEPSKDFKPSVSLRLSDPKTGKFNNIDSHKYSIEKDSTVILFSSKSLGKLLLKGRYTISKLPFGNPEVNYDTIVFIGNFTVNATTYPVKFTWFEGD